MDRYRLRWSIDKGTGAQSRHSEPLGVARAACFERLASVFASRVASQTKSPVSIMVRPENQPFFWKLYN